MTHIVIINPNTSQVTTAMMTDIARQSVPAGISVEGMTAAKGVSMILNGKELAASADGVVQMGSTAAAKADGIIVSAFGDPGLEQLRQMTDIPVIGICEASMLEAAFGGRRFGIATVTPDLIESFAAKAVSLRLASHFTGTRLTGGDPISLSFDPERLQPALAVAVEECLKLDGAEVVIIGGGPLGRAAAQLQQQLSAPVIAPIESAAKLLLKRMFPLSVAASLAQ
ncbi:aspartate/glutamate racemase family protein [Rhizobium leguminosarum]|uniref:aspartate/glutamate racemase family protein n=1 Tax=Rhizobium leguminosarum TaxID=384 RepID=UPI0014425AA2|nr:aspartate/glutamate racemase family protein [Rhizobium leguminosarum]NKL77032.1 aspartate/glutamate racemase family protein [Rhizobium leguminosarum bv. viciae]